MTAFGNYVLRMDMLSYDSFMAVIYALTLSGALTFGVDRALYGSRDIVWC